MYYFINQHVTKTDKFIFNFSGSLNILLPTTSIIHHAKICILTADEHIEQFL
jgi:hypothetical protein